TGKGVAGWERELAARGVLYEAKTTRDGTIIGYRVSLPGWSDPDGEQVWLKASQVDRALSWTRVHPQLDTASGVADTGESPDRPDRPARGTGDTRRREHRTAADLAVEATATEAADAGKAVRQSFRRLAKVPVVTRGDAEELLDVLTIRLRQWGRDTPPPPPPQ